MPAIKVFVSSTIYDMNAERDAAEKAIRSLGMEPIMSERTMGAYPMSSQATLSKKIKSSDIYVLVLGRRFGFEFEDGTSVTKFEYQTALVNNRLIFVYNIKGDKEPQQAEFAREVGDFKQGRFWYEPKDARDFGRQLKKDLQEFLQEFFIEHRAGERPPICDLPAPLRFIGRKDELAELEALVLNEAIVTVTGLGGIGKTALACRVAQRLSGNPRFSDGVLTVDCGAASSAAAVLGTLIGKLGLQSQAIDSIDHLVPFLQGKKLLLLFDNAETVLHHDRAAFQAMTETLRAKTDLPLLLTTSREALSIPGERLYDLDRMSDADAEALFRAIAEDRGYVIAAKDHIHLRYLLEQFEGYPLAICLCAELLPDLTLAELRQEWDQRRTDLLRDPLRKDHELDRTRSVNLSLTLSYETLSEPARDLFAVLSLFPAGADSEAIAAVYGQDWRNAAFLLTRKHLALRMDEQYRLLRPVRAYAAARLSERAQRNDWTEAFIRYHEAKAQAWHEDIMADRGKDSLRRFAAQYPNFHAAADLLWSRTDAQSGERLWQMVNHCNYLYGWNGLCRVGIEYLSKGLAAARRVGSKTGEANCLYRLGYLSFRMSDNESARGYWEQALPLYRGLGSQLGEANCLKSLGDLSFLMSDNESARGYWEQALPLYRGLGAQLGEANCLKSLGDLSFRMSDNESARGYYNQALALYQALGDRFSVAGAQASLARLLFAENNIEQGEKLFEQAIGYLESLPHYFNAALFLTWQALGYPPKKYKDRQRACLQKAADYFERAGNSAAAERCRRELGEI